MKKMIVAVVCFAFAIGVVCGNSEIENYRKAAEQGHVSAQFNLAVSYDTGSGVAQDIREAAKWYGLAAQQGHGGAQYNLAMYYIHGQGVSADRQKASEWLEKAAEQGLPEAQFQVLHVSANEGDQHSQHVLAKCYETGYGTDGENYFRIVLGSGGKSADYFEMSLEFSEDKILDFAYGECK